MMPSNSILLDFQIELHHYGYLIYTKCQCSIQKLITSQKTKALCCLSAVLQVFDMISQQHRLSSALHENLQSGLKNFACFVCLMYKKRKAIYYVSISRIIYHFWLVFLLSWHFSHKWVNELSMLKLFF